MLVIFTRSGGPPDDLGVAVTRVSSESVVNEDDAINSRSSAIVIGRDQHSVDVLAGMLAEMGLTVEQAATPGEAAEAIVDAADLVVADLRDGQSADPAFMFALRAMGDGALITVVEPDERVVARCLDGDVDDCITRPIHRAEFKARVRRRLRSRDDEDGIRDFGWITVDDVARNVEVEGVVVHITAREFDLISFLSKFPHTAFSRDELLLRVWGSSKDWQSPRTVTEHVYRLRRKLAVASGQTPLVTVPGAGYRFDP